MKLGSRHVNDYLSFLGVKLRGWGLRFTPIHLKLTAWTASACLIVALHSEKLLDNSAHFFGLELQSPRAALAIMAKKLSSFFLIVQGDIF